MSEQPKDRAADWIKTANGCLGTSGIDKPLLKGILRSGVTVVSELKERSTLEALAAADAHLLKLIEAIPYDTGDAEWSSDLMSIRKQLQSLTVSDVSLEKFAQQAKRDTKKGYLEQLSRLESRIQELRQPITNKSICSVGHVKANLAKIESCCLEANEYEGAGHNPKCFGEGKSIEVCIACQGERERRER